MYIDAQRTTYIMTYICMYMYTYLSSSVSLWQIWADSRGVLQVGLQPALPQSVLQLGKEPFAPRLNLLPLLQHRLVLLRLEEPGIDVVLHQLVDLFLSSGEGVAGRLLRVSLDLILDVRTDVHFTA